MRGELKVIVAGFGAGVLVGVIALTSVGASMSDSGLRADRLLQPRSPSMVFDNLNPGAVSSHVDPSGPRGAVVEFYDTAGQLVFRSDPDLSTTVVSKNTVIPAMPPAAAERPGLSLVADAGKTSDRLPRR